MCARKPNLNNEDAALFDRGLPEVVDWESFYAEGKRTPPFLRNVPDENLVGFVGQRRLESGSAIDLGCGIGRNAVYLAKAGFRVDAVDLSRTAIARGRQFAEEGRVHVNFIVGSVFDIRLRENHYDVAYDSGLFHHIPPHRRPHYLDTVRRALKTDGFFGMTCFDTTGGQPVEDREIYECGTMPPGIGYTEDRLRDILNGFFEILELRPMKDCPEDADVLCMPGLWTVLMKPLALAERSQ
ncbi:MAG: methyltransferase domain-containing protein [Gemmatimonadota bacterium]|nr:methyltransferase domain-containing protein [Gemmatimonadota bacterium]